MNAMHAYLWGIVTGAFLVLAIALLFYRED